MSVEKRGLRKEILAVRDALSPAARKQGDLLIVQQICGHEWFTSAEVILGFISYGSEIDTAGILQEAWLRGKKVYVPKVMGEDMIFYRITSREDLQKGYRGILEPKGDTESFIYQPERVDKLLMLMPGAVFDMQRNRIGYGKGFYDRYLADKKDLQLRTIGIGYSCQQVEALSAEEWDIKPALVLCV